MACDRCLKHTEEAMEAGGVPSAASGNAVSGLRQATISEGQTRCSHCGAWLSQGGQCKNPKCPGPSGASEDVEQERAHLTATLEALEATHGTTARVTPEQFTKAMETAQERLKAAGSEGQRAEAPREAVGRQGDNRPDRWLHFEMVPDVKVWAYDTPEDVWEAVFQDRAIDEVPHQIDAVKKLSELVEEIEAASPDDLENPTDSCVVPVPSEARDLGIIEDVDAINETTVRNARSLQARLQVAVAQVQEGRWDSVKDQLIGAELPERAFGTVGDELLTVVDLNPQPHGNLAWQMEEVVLKRPPHTRKSWSVQSVGLDQLVRVMSSPSVNVSFTNREWEEWREQWCDGRVSVGPAEPAGPFDPGVTLMDVREDSLQASAQSRQTHTYRVQRKISPMDSTGVTYDRLTKQAEDMLREATEEAVSWGEVQPVSLNVERRPCPEGMLWVTAVFDVVGDDSA